jgi:hypothetical protein
MTNAPTLFADLSDDDLLIELSRFVAAERAATAHLIELLAEVDTRRLHLGQGCSSLFIYCTRVLHLSEHVAYERITTARLARRFPDVLVALRAGDVTLTSLRLMGPHLTSANCRELLAAVRHKSKREVERVIAGLAPKPDVPASVWKVPARRATAQCGPLGGAAQPTVGSSMPSAMRAPQALTSTPSLAAGCTEDACGCREPRAQPATPGSGEATAKATDGPQRLMPTATALPPARPAVIAALAPERYKIQFTASREMHDRLRRAQDLLRHTIPDGDVAAVFDRALTLLVQDLERRKLATARRPRPSKSLTSESRYIPAAVKRIVWARDAGQCTFVGTGGRCAERGFLEFHHVVPFAAGGETSAGNLTLRCRAHNQFEAEQFFGPLVAREARAGYVVRQLGPDRGGEKESRLTQDPVVRIVHARSQSPRTIVSVFEIGPGGTTVSSASQRTLTAERRARS